MLTYGSVCSGIEAVSIAWEPLGFKPLWFAETDRHCDTVLDAHWPHVPNYGDITTNRFMERIKHAGPIDVLVGGTPCQSFSTAGLRGGLTDPRGLLSFRFLEIARTIKPTWIVWENVPGVLHSNGGRDFGAFLGRLEECGYWWSYRILDAQYFGVPQRRRRVFVVGHSNHGRTQEVLFEQESQARNPAPGRKEGCEAAGEDEEGAGILIYQCHGGSVGPMGTMRKGNGCVGSVPFLITSDLTSVRLLTPQSVRG